MTVKELINALQALPVEYNDCHVICRDEAGEIEDTVVCAPIVLRITVNDLQPGEYTYCDDPLIKPGDYVVSV